ncbi:hypothetical protein A3A74_04505 [Candidatus Roizmanbacteria bacterium RIFCSPLOWO2_01_FULL_35_13]|uniref:Uncharacterized protein n=1 Tax=Candidatus Roizmanbacteria bacterium RIFCSPLOWO2_01_FULL_35_13 TaxID=1802055 RepID=A0A1F7I8M0_9BACT|nr:MAG: hypothetical protein A3A74_04505 [Candidatus Roizmanbacteria bacterium RIFCSPLOWO2_01_FULL_35_13]
MNKKLVILSLILLLILIGIFIYQKKKQSVKKIHYHAGFQVYVDNKLQDFSGIKYMSIKPCGEEEEGSEENEQIEKAHLHDKVEDVVHVEAEGAKWKDLFTNINYKIKPNKNLTGYVNGKKIENILEYPIKSYDSIIIFSGNVDEKLIKNAVTRKKIMDVEKKSEAC